MINKKNWTEEKKLFLVIVMLSIIVVALFIYVYVPQLTDYTIKSSESQQYSIEIIEITGDCEDCPNISNLVDTLVEEYNLKIKSREALIYNSLKAEEIIDKYNIKTIPIVVILSKDIGKIGIDDTIFSIGENYALFDRSVPYIDLETNEIKGLVQLKEIQSDNCMECTSLSQLRTGLENLGVKVKNYEIIGSSSDKGKDLIEKNNLNFTSSLLISKNIKEYWWIFDQIENSFIEEEENYVFKTPLAPYIDLKDGKIKGKVDVILIKNQSCEDCFDVNELKDLFLALEIYFDNEKSIDISSNEGKNFLQKYNITAIPTIILSKEIKDYENLKELLGQIGTFEDDENFVFRKLDLLNVKFQEI